ncbi:hypothetical protein AQI95_15830 [Streptomyces yokosukanensis]|uniref:Lipoprotein n=1 Tax=Streptomyces yokosukanensis TaxID=67386 RepID=A0A101P5Q3_9ACTN|nr:hypothetical protein [Streptomyces yokosukanensis]KUN05404.1 hypothetical protein AQI95_15830 [Streptomyces yokosukanensis]
MRATRLLPAAAAVLALAGCGAGADTKAVPPAATGSLESLAAEVKCRPNMQIDSDEVRQAICRNTDGRFVFATFATDRGQREWINDAKDYGGYYLVGRKWVAVGDDGVVKALRGTLGGDVETGTNHAAHSAHGG